MRVSHRHLWPHQRWTFLPWLWNGFGPDMHQYQPSPTDPRHRRSTGPDTTGIPSLRPTFAVISRLTATASGSSPGTPQGAWRCWRLKRAGLSIWTNWTRSWLTMAQQNY